MVEEYYKGSNKFTTPFKYAISIIAPYIIFLNVADYDVAALFSEGYEPTISENPEVTAVAASFTTRFSEIMDTWINLATVEFLPLFYALIIAPVTAFYLSKFFRRKDLRLRYYYAFILYIMMNICTITFLLYFIGIIWNLDLNSLLLIDILLSTCIIIFAAYKTFQKNILKVSLKIILISILAQITINIPLLIIVFFIAAFTM